MVLDLLVAHYKIITLFLLDCLSKLISYNGISEGFILKKETKNAMFENGWFDYFFPTPFPNACIFAAVSDTGQKTFSTFTVGLTEPNKITIYNSNNLTGNDWIEIFAIGY